MARLMVITDPDTALGLRLAGVDVTEASDAATAAGRLVSLLKAREPGVVIYNEEYRAALSGKEQAALEESITPVFFPIPVARAGRRGEPRDIYLARLLRRAIGYQLKIKR